jgi:hypothetical protein
MTMDDSGDEETTENAKSLLAKIQPLLDTLKLVNARDRMSLASDIII